MHVASALHYIARENVVHLDVKRRTWSWAPHRA
jgi:hypothetical protein